MKISTTIAKMFLLTSTMVALSCTVEPNTPPTGFLDVAKYENGSLYATGWAADEEDGSPVKEVQVYLDGKVVGEAKLGIDRPGVAEVMKNPKWGKSGWEIAIKKELNKGSHTAYAVALDKKGATEKLHNVITIEVN
jgi:hypothetical protein